MWLQTFFKHFLPNVFQTSLSPSFTRKNFFAKRFSKQLQLRQRSCFTGEAASPVVSREAEAMPNGASPHICLDW